VEVDLVVDDGPSRVVVEVPAPLAGRLRRRGRDARWPQAAAAAARRERARTAGARHPRVDVIAIDLCAKARASPTIGNALTG